MQVKPGISIQVENPNVFAFLVEHFSDTVAYQDDNGQRNIKLLVPGSRRIIQKILDNNITNLKQLSHVM